MKLIHLKNLIPKIWIYKIRYLLAKAIKIDYDLGAKNIYIFLAADYGNLGDIAITVAQNRILKSCFPDYSILEIPASYSIGQIKGVIHNITPDDIITIVGGGNMGDMYWSYEIMRELIVSFTRKNIILSFPQTLCFSPSLFGKNILRGARDTYFHKRNLLLMAREHYSYNLMRRYFNSQVVLTPDIVLTLNNWKQGRNIKRKILVLLRSDKERSLTNHKRSKIEDILSTLNMEIEYTDTIVDGCNLTIKNKEEYLMDLFEKIASASLVVTDRLHGMIFSYISAVPAIVFSNNNHKVEGEYQWIKDCGYIQFYSSKSSLSKMYPDIIRIMSYRIDYLQLEAKRRNFQLIIQNYIYQFIEKKV